LLEGETIGSTPPNPLLLEGEAIGSTPPNPLLLEGEAIGSTPPNPLLLEGETIGSTPSEISFIEGEPIVELFSAKPIMQTFLPCLTSVLAIFIVRASFSTLLNVIKHTSYSLAVWLGMI
jgi:hypothetical protein